MRNRIRPRPKLARQIMTQSSIPSLETVAFNNQKINHALDVLVDLACEADQVDRIDHDELQKTSQLLLFFSLIGDSDSENELDSI